MFHRADDTIKQWEGYVTATGYGTLLRGSKRLHRFADKAQEKQYDPQVGEIRGRKTGR